MEVVIISKGKYEEMVGKQNFLQAGRCSKYCPARRGQTQGCRMAWQDNLTSRINVPLNPL